MGKQKVAYNFAGSLRAVTVGLACGLALAARAETAPAAAPAFTAAEMAVVNRNDMMRQVLPADPWLVRRVLDDLARQGSDAFAPPDGVDPLRNPDLRSSPEAAYDLFQLLKKAGSGKRSRPAK